MELQIDFCSELSLRLRELERAMATYKGKDVHYHVDGDRYIRAYIILCNTIESAIEDFKNVLDDKEPK
jgi:hypothetical protein